MRDIKFRVWDGNKFHYTSKFNMHFSKSGIIAALDNGSMVFAESNEIQQYTGLKDKSSKEIYEGDLLKFVDDTEKFNPIVVGWSNKFASFILNRKGWAYGHWFGESCNSEDCKIIGNIHQSPKLLK